MAWTPSRLTRKQMEERRLKGGRLLRQKRLAKAQIARRLGVSRAAVSQWARRLRHGGLRQLRQRPASGRPPRLSRQQQQHLRRILTRGALAAGFPTDRWTLARIHCVIARQFAVDYHPNYVGELLHDWKWSCQQPREYARERNDHQVRGWLTTDWPRIKKKRVGWA